MALGEKAFDIPALQYEILAFSAALEIMISGSPKADPIGPVSLFLHALTKAVSGTGNDNIH